METFWFIVLIAMLTGYVILDGYDFGAGIVHLLWARDEQEKAAVTRSIGPFWDANEVWLIAGGGVLFFAFPTLYASSFSGFYLPLMLILWLLIFRAIGLEMRHFWSHPLWNAIWDRAFGVASLLLALFFGLALGNVVRGVNLGGVEDGVSRFDPQYFFLPLWDGSLSPYGQNLGIIDWFTLILGIVGLVTLTLHGANWVIYKTDSPLNDRLRRIVPRLSLALLVLVPLSVVAWVSVRPDALTNFNAQPVLWLIPAISFFSLVMLTVLGRFRANAASENAPTVSKKGIKGALAKDGAGFFLSTTFIAASAISTGISLYPTLLHSRNTVHPDLTIHNATTTQTGLSTGLVWWPFAAVLVIVYFVAQFRAFRGKL